MQAVPSLIGTGTAIAAAASGLVFGHPADFEISTAAAAAAASSPPRHDVQPRRKISFDRDLPIGAPIITLSPSDSQAPLTSHVPGPHVPGPHASPSTDFLQNDDAFSSSKLCATRPTPSRHQKTSTTKGLARKLSLVKRQGSSSSTLAESRDSTSSSGSWIKKFAIRPRPLSHNGTWTTSSARSSLLLDTCTTSSITPSSGPPPPPPPPPATAAAAAPPKGARTHAHSSSAPFLSRTQTASGRPAPRNKLVKRSKSTQSGKVPAAAPAASSTSSTSTSSNPRSSKPHQPTPRRPATSHKRSKTLDQVRADVDSPPILAPSPTIPLAQRFARHHHHYRHPHCHCQHHQCCDRGHHHPSSIGAQRRGSEPQSAWVSFFHSTRLTIGRRGMAKRFTEASHLSRSFSGKRISLVTDDRRRKVHLVKPRMVSTCSAPAVLASFELTDPEERASRDAIQGDSLQAEAQAIIFNPIPFKVIPSKFILFKAILFKVILSMVVISSMTPKEHVSAPINGAQTPADPQHSDTLEQPAIHDSTPFLAQYPGPFQDATDDLDDDLVANVGLQYQKSHNRNQSSPFPMFPENSGSHVDSPHVSSPNGASVAHPIKPIQPSASSTSSAAMSQLVASMRHDRSSVVSGSASDMRGFISGDDDDVDFKSDTMYDSLRTAASSRLRAVETPLDSSYEDSPPGTAGNGKTKRLSIQELMLGRVWDEDRIVEEEDESEAAPIRGPDDHDMAFAIHPALAVPRLSAHPSRDTALMSAQEFGRLCLNDEFDEDWGEEDAHFSPLSPPSKGSSLNSGRINPNVRLALAGNGDGDGELLRPQNDTRTDRNLGSLFDWIEPADAHLLRPKTASPKQELADARGGRTSLRKGPAPAHIRSQSVPVAHDHFGNTNPGGAKYGTWGMGTKPVSEDWDEDFEFGSGGNGEDSGSSSQFTVPESIRASQPSVKAHSGQIRELSLLVNDLKRLCRHGRDMSMLEGSHKDLWKEAEGVIALASPDEDDSVDEGGAEEETREAEVVEPGGGRQSGFAEGDFEAAFAGRFDGAEPAMSKLAVVRERHSPNKRRSVFSPDDDIFGGGWLSGDDQSTQQSSRPTWPRTQQAHGGTGASRSVMEVYHSPPPQQTKETQGAQYDKKVHFDTNSLRILVRRAGELRDSLSDLIRHAERITHTPSRTPRERRLDSSPAFTRVFDDPNLSPQRKRNHGSSNGASPQKSPPSGMGTRLRPMTVN